MIPARQNAFHGIYPSTILPMRADFSPDWDSYAAHTLACAAERGITGVLCNGHAGENFVISRAEKRRAVQETSRAVGGNRIVVAGVNQESSLEAAAEAAEACEAGADAIMVIAPNSFALAQDAGMAERHHRIIASAVPGVPMFLFQNSHSAGHMAFDRDVLTRLLTIGQVVGIKEGGWEVNRYDALLRQVRAERPDVAVLASGDEHLLACYAHGSDGSMVSLADIVPALIVQLDLAVRRSDLPEARRIHHAIEPLADAIYGVPPGGRATVRLKHCLAALSRIPAAHVRPPVGPITDAEAAVLEAALAGLR
jgi:4-hydroxy-tetrahydrodipicolinate synthase